MTDTTAAAPASTAKFEFPTLVRIGTMLRRGDLALALVVLAILIVLILLGMLPFGFAPVAAPAPVAPVAP